MTWKCWRSKIHYFNGIHYCIGLTCTCICCSLFFISVNFCFSFVLNSLTYITIPKNNHGKIEINWIKKLTTTYTIQCIITTCICEGGPGEILTCNMALKLWHKMRWNGDKWQRWVEYLQGHGLLLNIHPPPLPPDRASMSMNLALHVHVLYFPLTKCTVRIQSKQSYRRGNLPHACDLFDQYKTTNALWEWFFLSLYGQIHQYFW